MKQILPVVLAGLATLGGPRACGQAFANFDSFTDGEPIMFDLPRRSPTTSGNIALTPNVGAVTSTFPAGNPSSRVYEARFSFLTEPADPWLRLTTSNADGIPNPTIDLDQNLAFDIYSSRDIGLSLGVRETGTAAAIGANGGTTGVIEWVGASGKTGTGPTPTLFLEGGAWTHVVFDIDGDPTVAFTGNGVIDKGENHKGVLEHLAIIPADGRGEYAVYLDNFEVTAVPEPESFAVAFGALLLGGALLRRAAGRRQVARSAPSRALPAKRPR